MVFSSTVFLFLFLPILLLLYYLPFVSSRSWRNMILLLGSLAFYAWGEPLFVFLMIFSVFVNWFVGLKISNSQSQKKRWLVSGILFDALIIGVFKYATFVSQNISLLLNTDRFVINIALPIGISFFTFQLMSYLFDIYYSKSPPQKNPLHVALYIALFPQLIAGPIVRYQQIEDYILDRKESFDNVSAGMRRFIYGLGKKVLIANFLGQIADNIFDYVDTPSVMTAWLGTFAYALQIYFDFSGYSDMAIGLGLMFGFKFVENFNYPYIARSITDFWRRWHISLSSWFRDYVYIPLGGNRVKISRWILNMFAVWMLTGIWHGANWTFVLWGFIYFIALIFERTTGIIQKIGPLSYVYTMLVVMLAWVFFRSADISSGIRFIGYMFGLGNNAFADDTFLASVKGTWTILLIAPIGATPAVSKLFDLLQKRNIQWIESLWLMLIFILSVLAILSASYNPFIYFNF